MSHHYNPLIHDPILTEMNRKWRRTDQEIADEMGFDKTTIGVHRKRLGLPTNVRPRPIQHPTEKDSAVAPPDKPNPVKVAGRWLGNRLIEKPSGFWLDGSPASLDAVMRAANTVLKGQGVEQCKNKPEWQV